jgi:hypothetical protein
MRSGAKRSEIDMGDSAIVRALPVGHHEDHEGGGNAVRSTTTTFLTARLR